MAMNEKRFDPNKLEGKEAMTERHNISIKRGIWRKARLKAGLIPISRVITTLLIMWLNDEIKIEIGEDY